MEAALRELINRLPGLRLMIYNGWKGPAAKVRARLGDGSFDGPYQVSDQIMQGLLEVAWALACIPMV